jgi:hypothetical protein
MSVHLTRASTYAAKLVKGFPFHVWIPLRSDLAVLRQWLAETPHTSTGCQVAMGILDGMEFGEVSFVVDLVIFEHSFTTFIVLLHPCSQMKGYHRKCTEYARC